MGGQERVGGGVGGQEREGGGVGGQERVGVGVGVGVAGESGSGREGKVRRGYELGKLRSPV